MYAIIEEKEKKTRLACRMMIFGTVGITVYLPFGDHFKAALTPRGPYEG